MKLAIVVRYEFDPEAEADPIVQRFHELHARLQDMPSGGSVFLAIDESYERISAAIEAEVENQWAEVDARTAGHVT